ncbi:MAG: amidohydrolase family protein, partial [Candidatus Binatia bacterium]
MAEFDTVIRGGTIVDGTRVPRYRGDLGIRGGKIAKIGKIGKIGAREAKTELDAGGMIVAPGAIDLHTHYDAQLHWDPYCSIGGWHGVTSVTIGNCGFGFAPVHAKDAERAMLTLSRNESIPLQSMQAAMAFDWETFPQWMDHLDRLPLGVNLSQLVPVSPLVAYVLGGFDQAKERAPDEGEMRRILTLFHEAMDAGAVGWSAQRLRGVASGQRDYDGTLMISDLLPDDFYLAFARALEERREGFMEFTQFTAIPNDPSSLTKDFEFNTRLAETSGRPVLYNAVIPDDRKSDVYRAQVAWIEAANRGGARVFGATQTVRAPATFTFE